MSVCKSSLSLFSLLAQQLIITSLSYFKIFMGEMREKWATRTDSTGFCCNNLSQFEAFLTLTTQFMGELSTQRNTILHSFINSWNCIFILDLKMIQQGHFRKNCDGRNQIWHILMSSRKSQIASISRGCVYI